MNRTFIGAALLLALVAPAGAVVLNGNGNSTPGLVTGQIPTAPQWNSYFAAKLDYAGGILNGPLQLLPSNSATAYLNISPGSAPSSPSNGDIWATSAGVFVQVNGSTVGPLGTGGGSSTITNGSTPVSGFSSGNVLIASGSLIGQVASSTTINGVSCALGATCTVSAAANLIIGSSTITGGSNGSIEYNNAGALGELATTGSGNVVRATSPTLVTPALGTPTAIALTNGTGLPIFGITGLGSNIGTALSTALNGTGAFAGTTSAALIGPVITSSFTATGLVTNADLVNASTSVNGQTCTLGSTCTISAAASLVVGSTTIASGSNGSIEFNNAGVLGEIPTTGSGNVVRATSPTLASPTITGAFTATGLVTNADIANLTPNATVGFPTIRRITTGATDTATTSDSTIVITLVSATNFTETLPACVSGINGQRILVKDEVGQAGGNPITVKATTSTVDTITGSTGFIMNSNFESVGFQCDSAATNGNWMAE